jgi:hypothetical protein
LEKHPDIKQRLCDILSEHLGKENFTFENIDKIDYLDFVIKESLRIYLVTLMVPRGVGTSCKVCDIELYKVM